jgi:hypothetical protein
MKWTRTADPDVIEAPPYFIRRCRKVGRYLLGRDIRRDMAECLGGFDSADEAKAAAEEYMRQEA